MLLSGFDRVAACNVEIKSEAGLISHYVNTPRHHWCKLCRQTFPTEQKLKHHRNITHYKCGGCLTFFKSLRGRDEHARQSHHYCMQHQRFFKDQEAIAKHYRTSAGHDGDSYKYTGCYRWFGSERYAINDHQRATGCGNEIQIRLRRQGTYLSNTLIKVVPK